jgi:hypothetical protein
MVIPGITAKTPETTEKKSDIFFNFQN